MVLTILTNVQYTGTYVSGRMERTVIGTQNTIRNPEETWIMIPDKHEPLISKSDFELVQETLKRFKGSIAPKSLGKMLDEHPSSKREKLKRGDYLRGNVIYGYLKNSDGTPRIDEDAAMVVREMFTLASQGLSAKEISRSLSESGYPTPMEHIKRSRGYDITPLCDWTDKCIRNTLKNIQYTGAGVYGKILLDKERGVNVHVPESDWVVIPDKNPVIISQELFDSVQTAVSEKRVGRKNMKPRDYLLRGGIVRCGCCDYAMAYDNSSKSAVYRCYTARSNPDADCYKFKINAADVDTVVLDSIRNKAGAVLNTYDSSKLSKIESGITDDFENRIQQCVEERQKLYEMFILREVGRDDYITKKAELSDTIDRLNSQVSALKQSERDRFSNEKTKALAKDIVSNALTPRELVETLIDKVHAFPGKRIEIQWKVSDFALAAM